MDDLEFKNGSYNLLFIKLEESEDWYPLALLKTNSWDSTTDQISTVSKCSGKYKTSMPGNISWSFKADGNAINADAAPSKISFKMLAEFQKAGTIFLMKMVDLNDENEVLQGYVYITSLSKSAGRNEAVGFSASFQGTGEYSLNADPSYIFLMDRDGNYLTTTDDKLITL